jgi:DNA replication and repair protein RecF
LRVRELVIRDFRNIAAIDAELPQSGVVILGANGQGKTNLLEAIYYLVLFRSMRGAKDRELVRFGKAGFFVAGTGAARVTAGYEIRGHRKKVTVDGAPVDKLGAAVGKIVAVPFSPGDRELVAGSPAGRRRYLDVVLSLSTPGYLRHLAEMRGALKQRNAALRAGNAGSARAFDRTFAVAATAVADARIAWAHEWRGRFGEICVALGEEDVPEMTYRRQLRSTDGAPEELEHALQTSLDRDLRRGATTVGPHRDDLALQLRDHSLRSYGSAGQQRTAAIALRILEAEVLRRATGHPPVALYDDVFIELDHDRQQRLLQLIERSLPGQAIVVAPRDSEVPPQLLERPRWAMKGGTLVTS